MWYDRTYWLIALTGVAAAPMAWGNPAGLGVAQGAATATSVGNQLHVAVTDQAILDWASFNIGVGETTTFHQPNAAAIVWNRILDQNPSQIFGNLNANGTVVLFNQNGFYFGPNSVVNVGSLIVTTAPPPPNLGNGGAWQFSGMPPAASIINYGQINVSSGGSVFLVAEKVSNHGVLTAPDGTLGLYAGKEVLISERPDGRGLSARAKLGAGVIDNQGKLIADAGQVTLEAQVVNVNGTIRADSVRERNGVIELVATEAVNLGPEAQLSAQGDASAPSAGGQIRIRSEGTFGDTPTTQVSVAGGQQGGDGGQLAISAPTFQGLHAQLDGSAQAGYRGGEVVIDPDKILIGQSGTGSVGDGTVPANTAPGTLELDVASAFRGFSSIKLQANSEIRLLSSTTWDLKGSSGLDVPDGRLSLESGGDIVFENNALLKATDGWSVSLSAGVDFTTSGLKAGVGSVLLGGGEPPVSGIGPLPNGNGTIEAAKGSLDIRAGSDVLVGSGAIRTIEGGSITVSAGRDVNAGTRPDGFEFLASGTQVNLRKLGGIATGAGGDVTIRAGGNVTAEAIQPGSNWPGASGAYGTKSGNVTIEADGTVRGNYVVRNGQGVIRAKGNAGTEGSPLTLNLSTGSWFVRSERDIFLNEIRNPAGTFDTFRRRPTGVPSADRVQFLSDYHADAALTLEAADGITLVGANLVRTTQNRDQLPIYPPTLTLQAGAGGIELRNSIILYPSDTGNLKISTENGGSLRGILDQGEAPTLVMSDSGGFGPDSFFSGHATIPRHLDDSQPAEISIDGDLRNLSLQIPKVSHITVQKDAYNFNYSGYNLNPNDITLIDVKGDFTYRANRTTITLADIPDFTLLDPTLAALPALLNKLSFDELTHELTFFGKMSDQELDFLLDPKLLLRDTLGQPVLDANGNISYVSVGRPFTTDEAQLRELFKNTQDASLASVGVGVAGRGKLHIHARNLDLGISEGIESQVPPPALAAISPIGPDIEIETDGNVKMASTKIAALGPASKITLDIGGGLDVGAPDSFYSDQVKGIFSFGGGSIDITTEGDVNVNGSRIATYDGGNLSIRSKNGDIDAGQGGLGAVSITGFINDPITGEVRKNTTTVPGSGILATSLPRGNATPGEISLKADHGDVRASKGGVVQLAFNNAPRTSQISIDAGGDIEAGDSGIIGSNVGLKAGGTISGLVVASENVAIQGQNFSGTAFGGGNVSVSASGNVSGTVVGGGAVSVSASAVSGAIVGNNVSASGNVTASVGVQATSTATTATKSDTAASEAVAKATSTNTTSDDEDEKKKRLASAPKLSRTIGRVTVILPPSSRVN